MGYILPQLAAMAEQLLNKFYILNWPSESSAPVLELLGTG
jgi:hypothetical protein